MYHYSDHRNKIFTEEGQIDFLETRDRVKKILDVAGAFNITKVMVSGDSWLAMAYVDRLVELGEIRELTNDNCRGQDRTFIKGDK